MGEEKQKTYQEWQAIIGAIGDRLFEEICYRLLEKLGFEEIKHRGGSADGGRDLEGKKTRFEPDNRTKYVERYWFECKCYSSTIPWKEIADKLNSAVLEKINTFIILSNRGLSPDAQDHVMKFMEQHRIRIIEWCGFEFLNLLFEQQELCDTYFHRVPIPKSPPDQNKPKHILKAVINLGEGFGLELQTEIGQDFQINENNLREIISNSLRKIYTQRINLGDEEKSRLFYTVAMLFSQFGLNDDAMTFVDNSLEIKNTIPGLINKAIILERMHKLPESQKIYEGILKHEINNLVALNNLAKNLKEQFLLKESLNTIEKALRIDPNYIPSINLKINILKDLKKYDKAIQFANEKINENSSITLQKSKVEVLIDALDLKEAFRINEQLLNLDPSDVDLVNNKGVIYEHNAKFQYPEKYFKLAFDSFAEARKKRADYILALSNQVVCFLNIGNISEAESLTNAGLAMSQDNPLLFHNKAKIELQKGNFKTALEHIEKAIKISSQEKFLLTKTQILITLRKYDAVEKLSRGLIEIDEKNTDAMILLAESLRKRHRIQEAQRWIKTAKSSARQYISLLE